jgi:hypothetical protein
MLKLYIKTREALLRLRADMDGTVSLEYVVVGAVVAGVVATVFSGTGANSLTGVLTTGFGNIVTAMTAG